MIGATPVPASCWLKDDPNDPNIQLPFGKNPKKGYFFTANADPTFVTATGKGVSDENNPLAPANQPYLSFAWDDSTGFRATRIDQMLEHVHGENHIESGVRQGRTVQIDEVRWERP